MLLLWDGTCEAAVGPVQGRVVARVGDLRVQLKKRMAEDLLGENASGPGPMFKDGCCGWAQLLF